jgi:hypothetical protein
MVLYSTLILAELKCASTSWNSIILVNAFKVEKIKRKFAFLCYTRFLMAQGAINVKSY